MPAKLNYVCVVKFAGTARNSRAQLVIRGESSHLIG